MPLRARPTLLMVSAALAAHLGSATAQSPLVGTYKGIFEIERVAAVQNYHPILVHTELQITGVEGDLLRATWGVYPPGRVQCRGEFVMEGWYRGGELLLHSTKPNEEGCGRAPLRLKASGDRFMGSFARWEIELSRD